MDAPAAETVGYCYYQISKFEIAIPLLQRAVKELPEHYYPRYFLALSLRALNRRDEAIDALLDCLTLNFPQADNILDTLLPLVGQDFSKITPVVDNLKLSNLNRRKLLFYRHRDNEVLPGVADDVRLRHFHSAKELADQKLATYLDLGPPEMLRYPNLDDNSYTWVEAIPPYVLEVSDATIMHGSSVILAGEDKVLSDLLTHVDYGRFVVLPYGEHVLARRDDALLIREPSPGGIIAEGIFLVGHASYAYGHWFAEFLPKLRFYEQHPRFAQLPIIVDEGMPQSHYDFLEALVPNKVVRLPKGGSLKVEHLFVAPSDTFFPPGLAVGHSVPPEHLSSLTIGALRWIGDKIVKRFGAPLNPSSRIFLSRTNSQWRKLVNEKQIEAELHKLGFRTVYTENLSFEEQVKIFQAADFVVAPNGSALSNLVFSTPKTKIIVLGQKNLFNWGTWFGSFMELGYSLIYLKGDTIGDADEKHSDYIVPTASVRSKVLEMLSDRN